MYSPLRNIPTCIVATTEAPPQYQCLTPTQSYTGLHIWRDAQPRKQADGSHENAQQLENRLLQKRIIVSKEN